VRDCRGVPGERICMNRAHSLNDHMFGFVNVVDDEDNQN
jgi:hypothetical protein